MKSIIKKGSMPLFSLVFIFCIAIHSGCGDAVEMEKKESSKGIDELAQLASVEDKCYWIDSLTDIYKDEIAKRIKLSEKSSEKFNFKDLPIDSAIGEGYMRSFRDNSTGAPDTTLSVTVTDKELAFFISYLFDMRHKGLTSLEFAFARLDTDYWPTNVVDRNLADRLDKDKRHTLVIGATPKSRKRSDRVYVDPFYVVLPALDSTKQKKFYDDWHEIWP